MAYIIKIRLNQDGTIKGFIFDSTGSYKLKKNNMYSSYSIANPEKVREIKINESTPESLGFKKIDR